MFTHSLNPFGAPCRRIRVEGRYNVQRLRHHLRRFGVETSMPVHLDGTGGYVLRLRNTRGLSRFRLQQLLAGYPYTELHS
jgi:hypothetical protein